MPIGINGSGTVTGISVGGLPDGIVDTDMLAANAVTAAKRGAGAILQVESTILDAGVNNIASNSGSPVGSGLITTVTPVAAGSKFLVMHNGNSAHLNEGVSNRGIRFYLYASVASGSYANVATSWIMSAHLGTSNIDFPTNQFHLATVSYSLGQTVAFQPYYHRGANSGGGSQDTYYWHHNGGSGQDTDIQQIVMEIGA